MVSTKPSTLVAQRTSDRIILLADSFGYPVTLYRPSDTPYTARSQWPNLPFYAAVHIVGIIGLVVTLYMTIQLFKPSSYRRAFMAFAGIAFIEYWPIWVGDTGLPTLNFGVPALGFLVSLHIIDIFFVRPPEEVQNWGPFTFMAQLIAFPNERKDAKWWRTPLAAPWLVLQVLIGNLFLYVVPPPEIYRLITPWSWPYIFYNMTYGILILTTLGLVVGVTFQLITLSTHVEMDDLFQNPLGASVGIRDFWSRWNCAIKVSLARAVFKLLQSKESAPVSRRLRKDLANASERFRVGTTRKGGKRYVDAFDETETELDSAPPSAAGSPAGTDDEGDGPRRSARRRNNASGPGGARNMAMTPNAPSKPRPNGTGASSKDRSGKPKKPGQLIKVFAALSTFFVSGAFHEEMLWASFPREAQVPGLQMAFFMSHGVVMCLTTVVARKYPGVIPSNPWLGWLGVQIFLWLTTPLFTVPFARYGFFEHLKAMSVFNWHSLDQRAGPVAGFVHLVKIR